MNADALFSFEEVDGQVRCFQVVDGKRGAEVAAGLNFHRSAWWSEWRQLVHAASLPIIEIPIQPTSALDELAQLADADQVVLRDAVAEYDVIGDAAKVRKQLAERMSRVDRGQLSSREAAALLAVVTGGSKAMAHEQIVKAFAAGALVFRNTDGRFVAEAGRLDPWFGDSGTKYVLAEIGGEVSAYTTREEMNKWLEREGHPDRLPHQANIGHAGAGGRAAAGPADPQRRLAALRALGGDVERRQNDWRVKGIKLLEQQEKTAGRPRSDQKTIRADLKAAAEAEREAQREGQRIASPFPQASR